MGFFARRERNAFLASPKVWLVPILWIQLGQHAMPNLDGGANFTFWPSNLALFGPIRLHLRLPIQHLQWLRRSGFWLDPPPLMRDIRPISMDKPLAGQPWYNLSGLYAWALDLDPSPPNQLPSIPANCFRESCRACTKMQTSNPSIGRGCLESPASKSQLIHASASVVPDVDRSRRFESRIGSMPPSSGRLPRRCDAVAAHGGRCSIDASSKMRDRNGQLVAEPLAKGCAKCRLHLELLATAPVELPSRETLLVHVDLETTGLNPLEDEIVELGAMAHRCGSRFGTTAQPTRMPDNNEPTVHGIGTDELLPSQLFK